MNTHVSPLASLKDGSLLKTQAFIDGKWVSGNETFPVMDPATGLKLTDVTSVDAKTTAHVIEVADKAFTQWSKLTASERGQLLHKWYALLVENTDDLARIMTAEQGKPFAEAKGEISYGSSFVQWFAEEGRRVYGETIPTHDSNKRLLAIRQPVGVCAAITPWNFPLAMITRKVAPALAAGCTVIIKPASETPLTALAAVELAARAGIPAGVINILPTRHSSEVGAVLCESPTVRHLSFTGSTEVGRILMKQCASTIKGLSLELGGNAPFIVFDDADLESAVAGALAAKYRNAGQVCVSPNRFYAQAGIYDKFVKLLAEKTKEVKVGNGFEAGVQVGPLIDAKAVKKVSEHIADAAQKGARVLAGGQVIEGQFFAPTVLADITPNMILTQEETFGPVAAVVKFTDEADVIRQANDTIYGLASYFYSRDIGRIWRVAEALEYGMVGINTGLISTAEVPFGGVKQSGLGREGGRQGIDDYVETKYLCMGDIQS
ncbi:Succinate-semialdehyde dehydrogenase [NADP(+)] GabD [Saezia sanguinis]|uniref:Succinate-semialdehyde dehydrogenase [NADP(+)] GabD n=1 Tax=Saezia sanguinis TaxID=1965230 RepID=A0A433SAJ0_9BURK|nr:NAD-dependent succinate-semialdehyde dehydrogenase [Saezia sanguinis]RUS65674.1 Succinate-semialdehyde dehydrogenase [NADP(+)] GabD [Saezia sanguinis]